MKRKNQLNSHNKVKRQFGGSTYVEKPKLIGRPLSQKQIDSKFDGNPENDRWIANSYANSKYPEINYITEKLSGDRSFYHPLTGGIHISTADGTRYDENLIAELAHVEQDRKQSSFKFANRIYADKFDDFLQGNGEGRYDRPGTVEYEAHQDIEPRIADDYRNYYLDLLDPQGKSDILKKKLSKKQFGGVSQNILAEDGELYLDENGEIQEVNSFSHDDPFLELPNGQKTITSKGNGGQILDDAVSVLSDSYTQVKEGERKNTAKEQQVAIKSKDAKKLFDYKWFNSGKNKKYSPSELVKEVISQRDRKLSRYSDAQKQDALSLSTNQLNSSLMPDDEDIYNVVLNHQEQSKTPNFNNKAQFGTFTEDRTTKNFRKRNADVINDAYDRINYENTYTDRVGENVGGTPETLESFDESKQIYKDYINSDLYRNRIVNNTQKLSDLYLTDTRKAKIKEVGDSDLYDVTSGRLNRRIDNIGLNSDFYQNGVLGQYDASGNVVSVDKNRLEDIDSTMFHEIGHATTPKINSHYLRDGYDLKSRVTNSLQNDLKTNTNAQKYYHTPGEIRSEIMELRKNLHNVGKPITEGNYSREDVNNLKTNQAYQKLKYVFSDDEIFELMNDLAYNDSDSDVIRAKDGIYIKPENRGKFNATKKRTGKSTEELTHSKNPITRKRAIFAQNAKKWRKGQYGNIPVNPNGLYEEDGPVIIPSGNITMEDIDYPVDAYDADTDEYLTRMQPNMNYKFKNSRNILEVPVKAQVGYDDISRTPDRRIKINGTDRTLNPEPYKPDHYVDQYGDVWKLEPNGEYTKTNLRHQETIKPQPASYSEYMTGEDDKYEVRRGDWISSVAPMFGLTEDELLDLNPDIKETGKILPGQRINVMRPPSGSTPPFVPILTPEDRSAEIDDIQELPEEVDTQAEDVIPTLDVKSETVPPNTGVTQEQSKEIADKIRLGKIDRTQGTNALREMMRANRSINLPYRAETPRRLFNYNEEDATPYLDEIDGQINQALQNVNQNTAQGQAIVANILNRAGQAKRQTINRVNQANLQRRQQIDNANVSLQNQFDMMQEQNNKNYVDETYQTLANYDRNKVQQAEYLDDMINNNTRLNNFFTLENMRNPNYQIDPVTGEIFRIGTPFKQDKKKAQYGIKRKK